MKTRLLMTLSALFVGVLGAAATFLPQEISMYFGFDGGGIAILVVQILGALYLGFAMLNWMARGVLIGGIYSRPVALGNFLHFAIVVMVLTKAMLSELQSAEIGVGLALYATFAIWFGLALFTSPVSKS